MIWRTAGAPLRRPSSASLLQGRGGGAKGGPERRRGREKRWKGRGGRTRVSTCASSRARELLLQSAQPQHPPVPLATAPHFRSGTAPREVPFRARSTTSSGLGPANAGTPALATALSRPSARSIRASAARGVVEAGARVAAKCEGAARREGPVEGRDAGGGMGGGEGARGGATGSTRASGFLRAACEASIFSCNFDSFAAGATGPTAVAAGDAAPSDAMGALFAASLAAFAAAILAASLFFVGAVGRGGGGGVVGSRDREAREGGGASSDGARAK